MDLPEFGEFSLRPLDEIGLSLFSCDDELEAYFQNDALDTEDELISKHYFLYKEGITEPIVGFSISNNCITACYDIDQTISYNAQHKAYPSILIGKFATHSKHIGNGYGKTALDLIKAWFITNNKTGCRFIIVDSRKDAVDFYKKCDFEEYPASSSRTETELLYFDLRAFQISMKRALSQ